MFKLTRLKYMQMINVPDDADRLHQLSRVSLTLTPGHPSVLTIHMRNTERKTRDYSGGDSGAQKHWELELKQQHHTLKNDTTPLRVYFRFLEREIYDHQNLQNLFNFKRVLICGSETNLQNHWQRKHTCGDSRLLRYRACVLCVTTSPSLLFSEAEHN